MIRIEKITIKEFRGIRDLELVMGGQNFAACGPNGTGKSGIVDAIEFALTGSISRLSGEGTGDLSVKQHGPHVDFRNTRPALKFSAVTGSWPRDRIADATAERMSSNPAMSELMKTFIVPKWQVRPIVQAQLGPAPLITKASSASKNPPQR